MTYVIFRGLGEDDSCKKSEAKNLVTPFLLSVGELYERPELQIFDSFDKGFSRFLAF
jgi:hypothetical protein